MQPGKFAVVLCTAELTDLGSLSFIKSYTASHTRIYTSTASHVKTHTSTTSHVKTHTIPAVLQVCEKYFKSRAYAMKWKVFAVGIVTCGPQP